LSLNHWRNIVRNVTRIVVWTQKEWNAFWSGQYTTININTKIWISWSKEKKKIFNSRRRRNISKNTYKLLLLKRVPLVEQELPPLPEHLISPTVFTGVRVTRSLVLYVCFVDRCLSFCTFSFRHCGSNPRILFRLDMRLVYHPAHRRNDVGGKTRKNMLIILFF
jgi:hypothetical protein